MAVDGATQRHVLLHQAHWRPPHGSPAAESRLNKSGNEPLDAEAALRTTANKVATRGMTVRSAGGRNGGIKVERRTQQPDRSHACHCAD